MTFLWKDVLQYKIGYIECDKAIHIDHEYKFLVFESKTNKYVARYI